MAEGYGELQVQVRTSTSFVNGLRSGRTTLPEGQRFDLPGEASAASSYHCKYFVKQEAEGLRLAPQLDFFGADKCDAKATVSLSEPKDGRAVISYQSEHVDLDIDLNLGIGPLPDSRLATLPDGFDVLGVYPGMPMAEAIAKLSEQEFTELTPTDDPTISAADWSQGLRIFTRGETFGSQTHPSYADKVTLIESTKFDLDVEAPETVVMVGRQREWDAEAGKGIAPDTLLPAISEKYGMPSNGALASNYEIKFTKAAQYDSYETPYCDGRANRVLYQTPQMSLRNIGGRLEAAANCGSMFQFRSSTSGSLINSFSVLLRSEPLMVRDVWRRYAGQVASKAKATFEALDSQTADKQKLDL